LYRLRFVSTRTDATFVSDSTQPDFSKVISIPDFIKLATFRIMAPSLEGVGESELKRYAACWLASEMTVGV
jgi:hypothetical protein